MSKTHKFKVAGQGTFPYDMLRYDGCCPYNENDSAVMENASRFRSDKWELWLIGEQPPTVARWESFGCKVIEE